MEDQVEGGSNVVSFTDAAAKKRAAYEYIEVYNLLGSKWMRLTGNQLAVMMFINLRTLKYGKASERIPVNHFTKGVTSAEGEVITPGLSMTPKTLYAAIRALEELEILNVRRGRSRCKCTVNVFEIDCKTLRRGPDMASKLRIPKPKKVSSVKNTLGSVKITHDHVQKLPVEGTDSNKQISNKQKHGARPARTDASLEENIGQITDRGRAKRKASAATVSKKLTQKGLNSLWEELMLEHYPSVPYSPLSGRQFGIFVKNLRGVHLRSTGVDVILEWAIENWRTIIGEHLSWMAKKEKNLSMPTLTIIAKYIRYFVEVYGDEDSKVGRRKRAVTPDVPDQTAEIARLRERAETNERKFNEAAKNNQRLRSKLKAKDEGSGNGMVELGGIDYESMDYEHKKWGEDDE